MSSYLNQICNNMQCLNGYSGSALSLVSAHGSTGLITGLSLAFVFVILMILLILLLHYKKKKGLIKDILQIFGGLRKNNLPSHSFFLVMCSCFTKYTSV